MLHFPAKFEKMRSLGRGAAGQTFLVRSLEQPHQLFALKCTHQSPEGRKHLEQEWKVLKSLFHPNCARVFDRAQQGNSFYFTSEYVEGQDVVSACRDLDWNAIFLLIVQAARALDYLHAQGFIHRDIKADNLLVGKIYEEGKSHSKERLCLKLIDFGLACQEADVKASPEIVGTLPYIAPEILNGKIYDHRVDLYSLGVVLYQIAIGRQPIERKASFADYFQALLQGNFDLSELETWGVPKGIVKLIDLLLRSNPQDRLSKASEIIEVLNKEEGENYSLNPAHESDASVESQEDSAIAVDASLDPVALIEKIRVCSRGGRKDEALAYVLQYHPKLGAWRDLEKILAFYSSAIHLWIDRGDFDQAQKYLDELNTHSLVQSRPFTAESRRANKNRLSLGIEESRGLVPEFFKSHPGISQYPPFEISLIEINLSYRKGDLPTAEAKVEQVSLERQEISPEQKARFFNLKALILKDRKKWREAVACFEKASLFAKEAQREDQELGLLMNSAAIWMEQGEWAEAYQRYQACYPLAQKAENRVLLARIAQNLGNLYLIFGRWSEAQKALMESLEIAESQHLKPLIAHNLCLLIQIEEAKGNFEKAHQLLLRAFEHAKSLQEAQPLLQIELEKAYFEFLQKSFQDCMATIAHLKTKAEKFQQTFYSLQSEWLETKCKMEEGPFDESGVLSVFERIESDAIEQGNLRNLWQVLADKASMYEKLGNKALAKSFYIQALSVLSQIGEKIPPEFRESFWRDRKKDKVKNALIKLEESPHVGRGKNDLIQFGFNAPEKSMKGEIVMTIQEKNPENKVEQATLSFDKWIEINRRLLSQTQVASILDEILDDAISITDAERGFVIYSESQDLDVRSSRNMEGETLKAEEGKFSHTIAQEVMRRGESIVIFDAQKDSRFSEAASVLSLKVRSVLCVPLSLGSKTVGLIYLDNRFREGVFQKEHLPILEALADQSSLALEHARLHQENLNKIEELKKSKELIEKLNQRLEKDLDETSANLNAAKESLKRQNEEISLRYTYDKIIGESAKLKQVLKKLDRIVDSSMSVFIHGESGTGKELIAQAIHFNGLRKDKPFVAENCTALPENLLESELFGYVQGAFTGADKNKIGLFELANGGTLFLDEVGDMPLAMQAKLLRVLQEGEVRQVGGKNYRKVDVRIITASNKDLKDLIAEGKFRQDLYYRINVVQIDLPPLRDRREDIPLLIEHFMQQEAAKAGTPSPKLNKDALKLLMNYPWPGNIRELLNEVTRFLSLRDSHIDASSLSPHILEKIEQSEQYLGQKGLDFLISGVEKKAIADAMQKSRGNKVKAAKLLKIGRRTLYAKLDLYKIDSETGKSLLIPDRKSSRFLAS